MSRKLITARARAGSTFDFTPPWKIVAAVVVRRPALAEGTRARPRSTSGAKSHRLARARRAAKDISRPTTSRRRHIDCGRVGSGWSSTRFTAAARIPMAVCAGGIEEWPPSPATSSSTSRAPFSATPTSATGRARPGMMPRATISPSSSVDSSRTPRPARSAATAAAPVPPGLLVVSEGEKQRAARREARGGQALGRFQDADHADLVVEGRRDPRRIPPAIVPCERGLRPFRLRLHRHHVLVRHHEGGSQRGVAAPPGVEEGVTGHDLAGEHAVRDRVGRLEPGAQRVEGLRLHGGALSPRDRAEADGGGQVLRGNRRVHRHRRRHGRGPGLGPEAPRPDHHDQGRAGNGGHEREDGPPQRGGPKICASSAGGVTSS
jgi:hypothetical protein